MPSVMFCGGRLDSLTVVGGSPVEVTTAGTFDSSYADSSVRCVGTTDIIQATFLDASNTPVDLTTGQTGFIHWEQHHDQDSGSYVGANQNGVVLVNSAGQPWVAIRSSAAGGPFGLYYNSGTGASPVWTQVGTTTFVQVINTRYTYDLKITLGSPHTIELSRGGSVVIAATTFTQAALTALRGWRASSYFAAVGVNAFYSQIMATEGRSTVGGKVKYSRATAAGGNTGWTGAYTNVNEAVNSDVTIDTAATAALRQTYAMGDVTVPSGYSIATVMHFLRAKNDGAAPANIKSAVRQSVTNYDYASNMPGIGTSFAPLAARYDTDPATAAAWTQSGFNSAEFGYLSVP